MSSTNETFDVKLKDLIEEASNFDLASEEATTAMRNLETFSKCRPPAVIEPEPVPEPFVPTTVWEKVKAGAVCVWDNETTRVLIKAGGAFAGVGLVAYSTIHRDHVLERQSLAQANQSTK
jgi:hypothetical protein